MTINSEHRTPFAERTNSPTMILPCPFCGKADIKTETRHRSGILSQSKDHDEYRLSCHNAACKVRAFTVWCAGPTDAIRIWNTRKGVS